MPRPKKDFLRLHIKLDRAVFESLDKWRARALPASTTRTEAVEILIAAGVSGAKVSYHPRQRQTRIEINAAKFAVYQ